MHMNVIINARSGANDKEEVGRRLCEIFRSSGMDVRVLFARRDKDVLELARRAVCGENETIVAGGGDGTINAVASQLVGTRKTLGVIPLGTFNYFATNLGIPLDLEGAVRNIIARRVVCADVGDVNGHVFLNNSSLGLYPLIVRVREKMYRRWGRSKIVAYLSVAFTLIRERSSLNIRLEVDGQPLTRRTPLVFIGNNEYQLQEFNIQGSACLRAGKLVLYVTPPVGRIGMLRLALRTLFRQLNEETDLQIVCTREFWVETRRKTLRVVIDGESKLIMTPLHFRLRPGGLRVIVPAVENAGPNGNRLQC